MNLSLTSKKKKTYEQLSTVNGSKLKINYKLYTMTIENHNLKIETPSCW
jgi:hypothetical protein